MGEGRSVRLWEPEKARAESGDAGDMEERFVKMAHTRFLRHDSKRAAQRLATAGGRLFVATGDGPVKQFDLATLKLGVDLLGSDGWTFCVDAEPATLRVAAGAYRWNRSHLGGCNRSVAGHVHGLSRLHCGPDQIVTRIGRKSLSENRPGEGDSPILLRAVSVVTGRKIGTVPAGSRIGFKSFGRRDKGEMILKRRSFLKSTLAGPSLPAVSRRSRPLPNRRRSLSIRINTFGT